MKYYITILLLGSLTFSVVCQVEYDTLEVEKLFDEYEMYVYNDNQRSKILIDRAYEISDSIGYEKGKKQALYSLGLLASLDAKYDISDSLLLSCYDYYDQLSNVKMQSDVLVSMGRNAQKQFRLDSADYLYKKAWEVIEDKNYLGRKGAILNNLGISDNDRGQYEAAAKKYIEAISYLENSDDKQTLAKCFSNFSVVLYRTQEYAKALEYQKKAMHLSVDLNNDYDLVMNQVCMSSYYLKLNDFQEAKNFAELAVDNAGRLEYEEGEVYGKTVLGDAYLAENNFINSERLYEEVLDTNNYTLQLRERLRVSMKLAEVQWRRNNFEEGLTVLDSSKEIMKLDTSLSAQDKMEFHLIQSKLQRENGQLEEAYDELEKSNSYRKEFVNLEKQKSTLDSETKYRTALIINENESLVDETKKSKLVIEKQYSFLWISIVGLLLLLPFSIWVWIGMKSRDKKNKLLAQKNKDLEALKREIEHRYLNQMNVAVKLLEDSKRAIHNKGEFNVFNDFENKFHAISLLGQLLSSKSMLKHVELKEYMSSITDNLIFNVPDGFEDMVTIESDLTPLVMKSEIALLIALIYTELFTNSIKHAFVGDMEPRIKLMTRTNDRNELIMEYIDNGKGMDTLTKSNGEGMQLIDKMVSQIKGSYKILQQEIGFGLLVTIPIAA